MDINIVVCTQPRTGSEWFGRLLTDRGFMKMREAFNSYLVHRNQPGPGTLNEKFAQWGQQNKNHDFVTKMMSDQIFFHRAKACGSLVCAKAVGKWSDIVNSFPHEKTAYIRLIRDSFDCARSQRGAIAAQKWDVSTQDVVSKNDISKKDIAWVDLNNAIWDYLLFEPHVVYYENLVENTEQEMDKVVRYINWVRNR